MLEARQQVEQVILPLWADLNEQQIERFVQLYDLYAHWNERVNLVSKNSFHHFYEQHVLHSLLISKVLHFDARSHILDIGTGGGFPGIPLAILYPQVHFTLIDSIAKKINIVKDVAQQLRLTNVHCLVGRVEEIRHSQGYDGVVSRAVAPLRRLVDWSKTCIKKNRYGLLCLKGGDLSEEMDTVEEQKKAYALNQFSSLAFFESKSIIHVRL